MVSIFDQFGETETFLIAIPDKLLQHTSALVLYC